MAGDGGRSRAGAPLPGGEVGALFVTARRVALRPGAVVMSEGDESGRVVLVLSGQLKVSTYSEGGRETVLGFRGRGDLIGELAAIDGEPHFATVTAVEQTEIATLTVDRFVDGLRAHPDAAIGVLRTVIARLRDADRKRAEFAELSADGRVAERLVELTQAAWARGSARGAGGAGDADPGADRDRAGGGPRGTGGPVTLTITQAEIAGWVGCSREAANRALNRFRDDGLVEIGRGRVTVLDVAGLRRVADA